MVYRDRVVIDQARTAGLARVLRECFEGRSIDEGVALAVARLEDDFWPRMVVDLDGGFELKLAADAGADRG